MKVVFFIPSLGSGGAERVVSVLASELVQREHEVHIAMLANRNCNYPLVPEITVHYLDCEQDLGMSSVKRYLRRLAKIRELVKRVIPDSVISFMAETNIDVCLALTGIPVPIIVSERNDPALDPVSRVKQWLRKVAYFNADHFVFQTPDAQAYFSQRIQKKATIVLNPLSGHIPEPFNGEREKRIVSVCRLNRQKNIPLLVRAFSDFAKQYPDYTLEIYGDGSIRKDMEILIDEMNMANRIFLKGFCHDVHQKIRNASMFVLSSDYEGMPNALMEAMAIGLPCISTDCPCGGPRMLIKHGQNGLLVPVANQERLTDAMCYMVEHPEMALEMGRCAEEIRVKAEAKQIASEWEKLIDKFAHKKR